MVIIENIGKEKLGFGYTLESWADHMAILSWVSLMSHHCNINKEVVNIEGRPFVELPSGKKVVITIKIEEYKEIDKNKLDHIAISG